MAERNSVEFKISARHALFTDQPEAFAASVERFMAPRLAP